MGPDWEGEDVGDRKAMVRGGLWNGGFGRAFSTFILEPLQPVFEPRKDL